MNQAVLVNKIRESSTQATGSDCRACPTAGLPILPVRYAVVPKATPGCVLPASCSNPLLDKNDQGAVTIKQSRYVLRTLRPGFLYLLYKNPSSGAWTWQCYMISPSGALREIPLSTKGPVVPTDPPCDSAAHNINSAIIALRNPEKISKAYIGYSEFFWSPETRERYKKAYQPRLIEFSPAEWMKSQAQQNAAEVTEVEKSVLEYSALNLSKYVKSGYFEYRPRAGQAAHLTARMERINPGKGMILAIPDPIGCVSDLNSYRMHLVDEYRRYTSDTETAWKHSCSAAINGIRELVKKQVKDSLKDAKPKYVSAGGYGHTAAITISKDDQIEQEIRDSLGRLENHYDEARRESFLKEYDQKCLAMHDRILAFDADYVSWQRSFTLAKVIADYDRVLNLSCAAATEVHARILNGGAISEASLKYWKELALKEATDHANYAISGILLNQTDWLAKFKNADEKNLVEHIWGDNKGKLYDFSRAIAESDDLKGRSQIANAAVNKVAELAAQLLVTVTSSTMAVIADMSKATGGVLDEKTKQITKQLEQLQIKLGLAYSRIHSNTGIALIQIDLTVEQLHRIMSDQTRQAFQGASRRASEAYAAMSIAAQVRLPPNGAAAQKLVTFTFWMNGTAQQIVETVESVAKGVVKVGVAASEATAAAGRTVADGTDVGVRKIRLLAHSLGDAGALAKLPGQVASAEAVKLASRISRSALMAMGSADVKMSSLALVFQILALRRSLSDFNSSIGAKHEDAAWAIASSAIGLASATADIMSKAWKVIRPNLSFTLVGVNITAAGVLRGAGYAGAGASLVDAIQASLKSNLLSKRGDTDAGGLQGAMAGVAIISALASGWMVTAPAVILGPVGVLLVCLAVGLTLAYLAAYAEDTAIGVWLDRCKFGRAKRIEGPFSTRQQELDSLEMIFREITVELEWLDKPFSSLRFDTDEISISVRRAGGRSDGLILGLLVEGPAGKRKAMYLQHGLDQNNSFYQGWPARFAKNAAIVSRPGAGFEAKLLMDQSEIRHKNEKDRRVIVWQEVLELDPAKFHSATLFVRYIPDVNDRATYFDDELSIADDSGAMRERHKTKRINNGE